MVMPVRFICLGPFFLVAKKSVCACSFFFSEAKVFLLWLKELGAPNLSVSIKSRLNFLLCLFHLKVVCSPLKHLKDRQQPVKMSRLIYQIYQLIYWWSKQTVILIACTCSFLRLLTCGTKLLQLWTSSHPHHVSGMASKKGNMERIVLQVIHNSDLPYALFKYCDL